jgi:hypothetical protein
MNQKIESPGFEEERGPRLIAEWIFVISIGGIIFLLTRNNVITLLNPWITAAGAQIQRGIAEFAGRSIPATEQGDRFDMLLGLLIAFVAGPTVFLFAWRKLRLGGIPQSFIATLLFVAGGAVTASVFAPSLPEALMLRSVSSQEDGIGAVDIGAVQKMKAELMLGLNEIAVDARSYSILADARGGGGRGFEGYTIPGRLKDRVKLNFTAGPGAAGSLHIVGSSPAYAGSSVGLELDSTRSRFSYEGVFKP